MAVTQAKKELTSGNLQEVLVSCATKSNHWVGIEFSHEHRRKEFTESIMDFIIESEIKEVESMIEEENFTAIKFKNGSVIRTVTPETVKIFNFQEILVDYDEKDDIMEEVKPVKSRARRKRVESTKNEALDEFLKSFTVSK